MTRHLHSHSASALGSLVAFGSLAALSLVACNGRLEITDDNVGGVGGDAGSAGSAGAAGASGAAGAAGAGGAAGAAGAGGAAGAAGAGGAAPSCTDGIRNGNEDLIDCGGGSCPSCDSGNACSHPMQCTHGVCTDGVCQPASCDDGLENGEEEGVDCGGASDCGPCLTLCQRECAVSDTLIPIGCDGDTEAPVGFASGPRLSDDGSIIAVDYCYADGRCTPIYWTLADGPVPLEVTGVTALSGMSGDGQHLLVSPSVQLGTQALLFSPDGTSQATGMRPYPVLLGAEGAVVGGTAGANGTFNLLHLPLGGASAAIGTLPFTNFVFTGATPDASVVVGYSGADAIQPYRPFRYTEQEGLVLGIEGLPSPADGASINALSRDGQTFAGLTTISGTSLQVYRWTAADGVVELGAPIPRAPGFDPGGMALSDDGGVLAFALETDPNSGAAGSFRWTQAGGVEALAPGNQSVPFFISGDGRVILGKSFDNPDDYRGYIWTEASGARSIRATLEAEGVDTTGWTFDTPTALSRDGRVAAGIGRCGDIPTAYRMVLPD